MAMIHTLRLQKRYGKLVAVRNLNIEIEEGDIFGFIGPNGAGKTTTLRILATLLAPSWGEAYIDGINVMANPYGVKRVVGFMPDTFGVYDGMRLREYLDFFGAAYKIPKKKRSGMIDDVLTLTDLTSKADDYVSAFSRGMKQRCLLAKTLIHDPKVLLLDEPASGLDPRARIELRELLKTLRGMGKTIMISSHILSELGDMCNKIGIIERGELLAAGDFREILSKIRQVREIRIEVVDGADVAAEILERTPGIFNVGRSGSEFQMEAKLGRVELAELHEKLVAAGVKVLFFEEDKGTLEDVFLQVTKGGI
jgi:ABC-2 type transport system ATP-binding protein